MEFLLAIAIGILYAAGIYLIMQPSPVKLVISLGLLSHGVNLLIFTIGRLNRATPPIISSVEKSLADSFANPLPQALVLTAIVINFGILAFVLVLLRQASREDLQGLELDNS